MCWAFLLLLVSLALAITRTHASDEPSSSSHHLRGDTDIENDTRAGVLSFPLVPHYARYGNSSTLIIDDPALRRRRRLDGASSVDELYQGYGTHYVDLWIGTPNPQRQTLIVDTGSAVTAFPCEACSRSSCGSGYHTDSYYRESQSETFRIISCSDCTIGHCSTTRNRDCAISVSYQEGSSWRAFEASDLVYSGGPHSHAITTNSFRMHFGCQTKVTGLFKTQLACGIMGMEMAGSSFWKQMYKEGALQEKMFALCLSRQPTASREGTGAGAMTLGGVDKRLHTTEMVYANQVHSDGWFVVRLKHMFLRINGGERVQVSSSSSARYEKVDVSEEELNGNGMIILDSGTTDTYLAAHLSRAFDKAWSALMKRPYDNISRRYTEDELSLLPTILFQLEASDKDDSDPRPGLVGPDLDAKRPTDVLVAMPPAHYMEYNPRTRRYSSRLYFNENHGGVLGANFMMGHDVLFDMKHERVGFAESDCDYSQAAFDEAQRR